MTDQRNFRSAYLGKVGIKGVEEKKSLEILLKEQPLDYSKLVQFCLRFPVPAFYRIYLWKLLLGVLPCHQLSHEYVMQQRKEQYEDLEEALQAMRRVNKETPLSELHLKMFLIEEGRLPFDEYKLLADPESQTFIAMSRGISDMTEDPVEAYWMTTRLFKQQERLRDVAALIEKTELCMKKEDSDGKLHVHLSDLQLYRLLPLEHWFKTCYAGVLPETTFERIWDKAIGGSTMILVCVAVAIFITFRRPILAMNQAEDVIKYLSEIPEDSGDIIVSKGIEIWQKMGSPINPASSKSDSPACLTERPAS